MVRKKAGGAGNSERPIGVFDSGIGGLTVARAIHRVLPHEDLVYLGDTARVPYGTKAPSTVVRFSCEDTNFLLRQEVKAVVVACNTASAWALPTLQREFNVPVFGVIVPGAQAALAKTKNKRIGVIGTNATIRSGAYARAILEREESAEVFAQACPLLVPLVEEGWVANEITRLTLEKYLEPFAKQRVDTLVLGCTHYPLLKRAISKVLGKQVALVDSAETCAKYVEAELSKQDLLVKQRRRPGKIQPYVTDETAPFESLSKRFIDVPLEPAVKVDVTVK
jgi:glutamate racemase